MARLGELLVAAKLLTPEQLEQALRAQVMWGGRLGTNIIELGFLDLDQLSDALGRQHGMPAALARHFDMTNAALQRKLSPEFAERYAAVPLMQVASGRVVVASIGRMEPRGIAILADELESTPANIVISVAAELRIRYHLERAFGIPRGARFLRSRGKTIPPFPAFVTEELNFEDSQVSSPLPIAQREELAELHAQTVAEEALQPIELEPDPEPIEEIQQIEPIEEIEQIEQIEPIEPLEEIEPIEELAQLEEIEPIQPVALQPSEPIAQIDDAIPAVADDGVTQKNPDSPTLEALGAVGDLAIPSEEDEKAARERRTYVRMLSDVPSTESERQKLGRIAIRRVQIAPPTSHVAKTLGEATRAIRRSTDRDKVAELVMLTLEKFVPSLEAAVMLVLRGDVAIGWKGYGCGGQALPEVAVPLGEPGLIPRAISNQLTMRAPSGTLDSIDRLLLTSLGVTGDKELVVVPVMIAGQVMLVMVMVAAQGCEIQSAESIAVATGAAFARLMRDASR
jgi:hypothetical protein